MERVAFLIEETGERIRCMLNPESLLIRRRSGLKQRESIGGFVAGSDLADDPLIHTNGGSTEIQLDLVFDVSLPGSSIETDDVRDLTRPLWNLSENAGTENSDFKVPLCRFVWGKQWNMPGVICSIAERLEYFTATGEPRRSWLRLLFRRVVEEPVVTIDEIKTSSFLLDDDLDAGFTKQSVADIEAKVSDVTVSETTTTANERLDQLAYRLYGDCRLWRCIAAFNFIPNPMDIVNGMKIDIPGLE